MKQIIILFFILFSTITANFLDVSVEQRSNYTFEEQFFLNLTTTENQSKTLNGTHMDLDVNLNDMGGILYTNFLMDQSNKYETKGVYFGSAETIYVSFVSGNKNIYYDEKDTTRNSKDTYQKLTFLDILSIENHKYSSNKNEEYSYTSDGINLRNNDTITREYTKEIYKISTENLYRKVKLEALKGEDFFYGIAGAKNIRSHFRIYGLILASYEYHDISEGRAYDTNNNSIIAPWGGTDDTTYYEDVKGKFKGIGYGYHLSAEFYYKDISFFITNYYKKTQLKNYHTAVRDFEPPTDPTEDPIYETGVIRTKSIELTQQYTSFGLHYRF